MEYEEFLQKVKSLIEEKGFDQTKLAKHLGIKNTQLNTQLNDATRLYMNTLFRIATIIGVDVSEFFGYSETVSEANEQPATYYHSKKNSDICLDQLKFMREIVRDQIQIIKTLSNEKNNVSNGATA